MTAQSMLLGGASMGFPWAVPAVLAQADSAGGDQITFLEMFFFSGDWFGIAIIWVILALSVLSIGLMIHLTIRNRRAVLLPQPVRAKTAQLIAQQQFRQAIEFTRRHPSYLAALVHAALVEAPNGYGAMERAIEEAGDAQTTRLLRPVEYLNIIGNIAPMLGLFGTVYGMILAFQELVAAGGNPDPVQLADGISTALVTTFWGLVVAIPALAVYALIRNQIDALTSEGMLIAEELISPFKPAGGHAAAAEQAAESADRAAQARAR